MDTRVTTSRHRARKNNHTLLKAITDFVLGNQAIEDILGDSPLENRVKGVLDAVRTCLEYIAAPLSQWNPTQMRCVDIVIPVPGMCDERDVACLQACLKQAQGRWNEAADLLNQMSRDIFCFPLDLMTARQLLKEGRQDEARREYQRIIGRYAVVMDEIP